MCKRHPHADVICAWANGKTIQQLVNGEWLDVVSDEPLFSTRLKFRIKPEPVEVRTCNGVVITPMEVKPALDSRYYLADPTIQNLCQEYRWTNGDSDRRFFVRGLVHSTAQSAREHALAMLANKTEVRDV